MSALALALLGACAPKQAALPGPERLDVVEQFALRYGDHTLAGSMVAVIEGERVTVSVLSPAGTEVFRVIDDGGERTVTAPSDEWRTWLQRLPIARDVKLVHSWACPPTPDAPATCSAGGGVLEQTVDADGVRLLSWRGPGGKATARISPGRAELADELRGYTALFVGEAVGAGDVR